MTAGTLLLTDRRLVFFKKGLRKQRRESMRLADIQAVEITGMLTKKLQLKVGAAKVLAAWHGASRVRHGAARSAWISVRGGRDGAHRTRDEAQTRIRSVRWRREIGKAHV